MSGARRRLDPETRRRQILGAATTVFALHDPSEVSIETVAEAAGVSRALVYTYFGDRHVLLAAVYRTVIDELDGAMADAIEGVDGDRDRLTLAVEAYLAHTAANPECSRVIAAARSSHHDAVRAEVDDRIDRIVAALGQDRSARLLVRGLVSMLDAAAMHRADADGRDAEELRDLLAQVMWTGISSLPPVDES